MKHILLIPLLLALLVATASGQSFDALSETTTAVGTDKMIVQTNSAGSAGQRFTRSITLSNLWLNLTNLFPIATSGGAATNAVSTVKTNGTAVSAAATSINVIAGTNVVLNATNTVGLVDLRISAAGSSATGGTNIYTNAVYLNAYGTAIQNGALLTNAATSTAAGSIIYVGPGLYYIPTNGTSLLKDNVTIYFEDGAIVSSGIANDTASDRWLFDDWDGAVNARVLGYGTFYHTNSSSAGSLAYIQNVASVVHLEYKTARTVGQSPCIVVSSGDVTLHGRELTRSDSYDALYVLGGKVRASGSRLEAGDSIIETSSATAWGDQVFDFAVGEALSTGTGVSALNIADNVVAKFGAIYLNRSASIYGNLTNANNTGTGILEAGVIFAKTNSTYSVIAPSGSDVGTAFTLKNTTIHGPWNVDAINANTMGGKLTLQNVTIYNGPSSTNWGRGINSSRVALHGALTQAPLRPTSSTLTLSGETNLVHSVIASSSIAAPTVHLNGGTTASRAAIINSSTNLAASSVTETELGYLSGVTSAIQTQFLGTSNRVVVAAGTGGITVTPSGSGGVMTFTVSDDDAGGGSATNLTTIAAGSGTFGSLVATQRVQTGQIEVRTNAFVDRLTVTNWATIEGPLTNNGAFLATATATFDGVVTANDDVNVLGATTVVGLGVTGGATLASRMVETIDKTGASIDLSATAGPHYSIQTNTAPTFTFSGTPIHGQRLSIMVSNTSSAQFTVGFPTAFSVTLRSNVTGWPCAASNYVILPFIRTTNEIGGGIWLLDRVTDLEAALAVASAGANGFLALSTNAGGNIVTISNAYIPQGSSMALSNLAGVNQYFTNGQASSMVLSNLAGVGQYFTNGQASSMVLSNVAASGLGFATVGVVSNLSSLKYAIQQPAITASNLVLSFATNRFECVGLTNVILTNLVEEVTAVGADMTVLVRATTGNTTLVWPSYGAQHGYFLRTNQNNYALGWAAVTNGKTAVISFTAFGTNIFTTITEWP